jgi:molybdenum cofactor biosynthesis enzyme MoaA
VSAIEYSTSKAVYHTDKIKALQEGRQIVPTEIQVDLEAYCNDNCSFCSYRKEDGYNNTMLNLIEGEPSNKSKPIGRPSPDSRIPLEFADTLPEQMVEANIPAIEITGGGEPTLWPSFDTLLSNLGKARRQVGLVTNGSNLSESRITLVGKTCTWVRISMDASNQETHKAIHRTGNEDFERRIENITKIAAAKQKDLVLGISFIITPQNVMDIHESAKLYSTIQGVNHLRFSWMYDREGHAGLTYKQIESVKKSLDLYQEEYDRDDFKIFYEKDRIDTYTKPNDDFKKCYYQRFVWAIGADCNVYPCCIMKYHPDFAYANIREQTLAEIVNDINTCQMMDGLVPAGCFPCWLRNRNKAIAKAVEKPIHHNFI